MIEQSLADWRLPNQGKKFIRRYGLWESGRNQPLEKKQINEEDAKSLDYQKLKGTIRNDMAPLNVN